MLAPALLTPLKFDTGDLPHEYQFEAWRAYNASVIDVSVDSEMRGEFAFSQEVWDLGKLVLTTSSMPGRVTPRNWLHLRKNPLDHWCVVIPESRRYTEQTAAGSPQVYFRSLGRPFEGAAADCSVSTLFIPRDLLRPIAASLDAHSGVLDTNGLGGLFADFLIALERRLPFVSAEEAPRLVEAICAMITACVAPTGDRLAAAGDPIALTLLERARRAIQQDLCSPDLSPDSLCRKLGTSRSKLYSLFEPLNGVTHYIQRQRLLAAHEALCDAGNSMSVQDLAETYCFSDLASFSRAFRRVIGQSPRDVRAAALKMERSNPPQPLLFASPGKLTDIGPILRRLQV